MKYKILNLFILNLILFLFFANINTLSNQNNCKFNSNEHKILNKPNTSDFEFDLIVIRKVSKVISNKIGSYLDFTEKISKEKLVNLITKLIPNAINTKINSEYNPKLINFNITDPLDKYYNENSTIMCYLTYSSIMYVNSFIIHVGSKNNESKNANYIFIFPIILLVLLLLAIIIYIFIPKFKKNRKVKWK